MAEVIAASLNWSEEEYRYQLWSEEHAQPQLIPDSAAWFCWLDEVSAFTFQGRAGSYMARRSRDGRYWYARARVDGRLKRRYLGKTGELTIAHLEHIAFLVNTKSTGQLSTRREAALEQSDGHEVKRSTLLASKFHIPRLPAKLVQKEKLLKRLDRALESPLTLIAAPAGFGKTTLLSMWLQTVTATAGVSVIWISLSAREDSLIDFWLYVFTALNTVVPGGCEKEIMMLLSPRAPDIETILTSVINALTTCTKEIVIVLDDYHLITRTALQRTVAFFLKQLPPCLHLVIATREDPPLPLARMRTQGELVELRFSDLRWTHEEVTAFFNQVAGLELSAEEIRVLEARAEGWIAGLQLAALSLQGQTDRASFIRDFTGSNRYIVDYLVQEVFSHLPEQMRTFLLATSILERLHGPLCDAVTQQQQGQQQLEALEQANLFVLPLDDRREWYRYHQLFADVLRRRLGTDGAALGLPSASELHCRAATWYEEQRYFTEAISHLKAAGNQAQVVRLIEQHGMTLISRGELATLLRWIAELPGDVAHSQLGLCLIHAEVLAYCGLLDAAEARLLDVEHMLREMPLSSGYDANRRLALQGEIFAIHAMLMAYQGQLEKTLTLINRALPLLPPDSDLHAVIAMSRGIVYKRIGDDEKANEGFIQASALSHARNMHVEMISIANRGIILQKQGQFHEAVKIYQQAVSLGQRGYVIPTSCMAYHGLGEIHREWNNLKVAQQYLQTGLELAWLWGYAGMVVEISIALAQIQLSQNCYEAAMELLKEAEVFTRKLQDTYVLVYLQTFQAQVQLLRGNYEAALRWQREVDMHAVLRNDASRVLLYFLVQARLEMARGEFENALTLLERLRHEEETHKRVTNVIRVLLLQALVYQEQQKMGLAQARLAQALTLGQPEGYVRVFVDEGPPLTRILLHLRKSAHKEHWYLEGDISREYMNKLLALMEVEMPARKTWTVPPLDVPPDIPPLNDPLSNRELEILNLMAAGYSNNAIAVKLVVALSTVKSHVNTIYRKLQAENRTQAIVRARALHLLSG